MAKRPSDNPKPDDEAFNSEEGVIAEKVPKLLGTTVQVTVVTDEPELKCLNELIDIPCKTSSTWLGFFNLYAPWTKIDQTTYEIKSTLGKIVTTMEQRLDEYLAFSKKPPKSITVRVVRTTQAKIKAASSSFQKIRTQTYHIQAQPQLQFNRPIEMGAAHGIITKVPSRVHLTMDPNSEILMQRLKEASWEMNGTAEAEQSKFNENSDPQDLKYGNKNSPLRKIHLSDPIQGTSKGISNPFDFKRISENFCARVQNLPRCQPLQLSSDEQGHPKYGGIQDINTSSDNGSEAELKLFSKAVSPANSNATTKSSSSVMGDEDDDYDQNPEGMQLEESKEQFVQKLKSTAISENVLIDIREEILNYRSREEWLPLALKLPKLIILLDYLFGSRILLPTPGLIQRTLSDHDIRANQPSDIKKIQPSPSASSSVKPQNQSRN